MITRKDFIDNVISGIDTDINIELEEALGNIGYDSSFNIFLPMDPIYLNESSIKEYIVKNIEDRGFYIEEIKASSDAFPKIMITVSLFNKILL